MFNAAGFASLAVSILIFATAAPPADASNRKMQRSIFNTSGTVPIVRAQALNGRVVRIDESFAARFGFQVPAPFEVSLPQERDLIANVQLPDQVADVYARISFSALATGEFQTLDITPLRIGLGSSAQRRQIMSQLLITRVFASLTARYIDKRLEGVNLYALAGADSVVLNGNYWDPKAGDVVVRIYAVMPKDKENGLLFYERRIVERAGDTERYAEDVVRSVVFD